ncbi:hypothetical protein MRX96_055836 [Rhipicephalus microplus]
MLACPTVRLVITAACHIARLAANLGHRWQTLDASIPSARAACAGSSASQQPLRARPFPGRDHASKAEKTAAGATACTTSSRTISCCPVCHRDGDSVVVTCFV